jgi:hypothetical protein
MGPGNPTIPPLSDRRCTVKALFRANAVDALKPQTVDSHAVDLLLSHRCNQALPTSYVRDGGRESLSSLKMHGTPIGVPYRFKNQFTG